MKQTEKQATLLCRTFTTPTDTLYYTRIAPSAPCRRTYCFRCPDIALISLLHKINNPVYKAYSAFFSCKSAVSPRVRGTKSHVLLILNQIGFIDDMYRVKCLSVPNKLVMSVCLFK